MLFFGLFFMLALEVYALSQSDSEFKQGIFLVGFTAIAFCLWVSARGLVNPTDLDLVFSQIADGALISATAFPIIIGVIQLAVSLPSWSGSSKNLAYA